MKIRVKEKSQDPKFVFRIEDHLDGQEAVDGDFPDFDVSPIYFTGIENFLEIRLKRWTKEVGFCQYRLFDDPDEIRGDGISKNVMWKSERVAAGGNVNDWPELEPGKEYAYLVHTFREKDDQFPYQRIKGKFWIMEATRRDRLQDLLNRVESEPSSANETDFIRAGFYFSTGAYEKALAVLFSLHKKGAGSQTDILERINALYEAIANEMEKMEWFDQKAVVDDRRYSLIFGNFPRPQNS